MTDDERDLKAKGIWTAVERDPETGEVLNKEVSENVITGDGTTQVAQMIIGGSRWDGPWEYIGVGDGAMQGDIAGPDRSVLYNELTRKQDSSPTVEDAADGHKAVWTQTFGPGLGVITEYGLFNAATEGDGTMLSWDIAKDAKDAQDAELTLTYELIVIEG